MNIGLYKVLIYLIVLQLIFPSLLLTLFSSICKEFFITILEALGI